MANRKVGDFPVKGKVVLITGGGSGIGLSFVKLCHSKGARVLIGDLKLTTEADEFIKKTGDGSVAFTQCDVSDWKALRALITTSVEKFGEVPDVYCPCAGIFEPPWSNFWDDGKSFTNLYLFLCHTYYKSIPDCSFCRPSGVVGGYGCACLYAEPAVSPQKEYLHGESVIQGDLPPRWHLKTPFVTHTYLETC